MIKVILERDYLFDRTIGCLSYISFGKWYEFATLELPYKNNEKMVSCIPENDEKNQTYIGVRHFSPKFGKTFSLDSPGRSGIIFHAGNTTKDTQGCILIGDHFEMHKNDGLYLKNSVVAFERFKKSLDAFPYFELIIKKRVG